MSSHRVNLRNLFAIRGGQAGTEKTEMSSGINLPTERKKQFHRHFMLVETPWFIQTQTPCLKGVIGE